MHAVQTEDEADEAHDVCPEEAPSNEPCRHSASFPIKHTFVIVIIGLLVWLSLFVWLCLFCFFALDAHHFVLECRLSLLSLPFPAM